MSKSTELRSKYSKMSDTTFDYFNNSDITPTKKYLEYMLKMWAKKSVYPSMTKVRLASAVLSFDQLLPYIENKDIYSKEYSNFNYLFNVVEKALSLKEENTFVREDHVYVLNETDTYLLLHPKTFQGSKKYGAGTRWCTTSNATTFRTYKNGLVYLIDKTNKRKNNFKKIGLYSSSDTLLNSGYDFFNEADTKSSVTLLLSSGWTMEELVEIDAYFRGFNRHRKMIEMSKERLDKAIKFMAKFNSDTFLNDLNIIHKISPEEICLDQTKDIIEKFNNEVIKIYKSKENIYD